MTVDAFAANTDDPVVAAGVNRSGLVTNLEAAMSIAPVALESYRHFLAACARTSFTHQERQIVLTAVSAANQCDYCVAWHDLLVRRAGLSERNAVALTHGQPLDVSRLEALRRFATSMTVTRGQIDAMELQAFLSAGWTQAQALEVVLCISVKTLSNYATALLNPAFDSMLTRSGREGGPIA